MCLNEFDPELYQEKYRIKSIRHPDWDYSSDGYYFVTICTKDMECIFGEIKNGMMGLSEIGCIANEQWAKTAKLRQNVRLDEWIIMPNHVHGIIIINNATVETHCNASLPRIDGPWKTNQFGPQRNNLASIVRGFKSSVKRICNKNGYHFQWQSRFYDRIIRDEKSLDYIREYIHYNPLKWELDRNNPVGLWM